MDVHSLLKDLNLIELNTMLKHIRLGKEHLEKTLSPETFQKFLRLSTLKQHEKEKIKSDAQERTGNIALVLNTVVTGIVGIWLGLAGFSGLNLRSVLILIFLVIFLAGISGWLGFVSYQITKRKSQEVMINKKLRLIELRILEEIQRHRESSLRKDVKEIQKALMILAPNWGKNKRERAALSRALRSDKPKAQIYEILQDLVLENISLDEAGAFHPKLKTKIEDCLQKLQTLCAEFTEQQEKTQGEPKADFNKAGAKDYMLSRTYTGASNYVKILTTPGVESETVAPAPPKWFKNNAVTLATGLAPTLFGGFSSMFVFLGGAPNVLRAFEIHIPDAALHQASIQVTGIGVALGLTLYYCYSYVHSNYKSFLREKEVEKTEKEVAEEGEIVSKLTVRHNKLIEIKAILEELTFTQTILKTHKSPA